MKKRTSSRLRRVLVSKGPVNGGRVGVSFKFLSEWNIFVEPD